MKTLRVIIFGILIIAITVYIAFCTILPVAVNNSFSSADFAYKDTLINYDGLNIKTFPKIKIKINSVYITKEQKNIFEGKLLDIKSSKISADYIFADIKSLQALLNSKEKKSKRKKSLKKLQKISVKEAVLLFKEYNNKFLRLDAKDLTSKDNIFIFNLRIYS
ncbi:hypothetical protein II906_04730, partial [bacterium]|nr:hypothetical protein [bacterium]